MSPECPAQPRLLRLPFHGSGRHAADDVALEEEGQNDRRESHQNATGHHARNVDGVAADEFGNRYRRSLGVERAGEDQGVEEFIPGEQEGEHGGGDQARHGDGHDDFEQDL